MQLQLYCLSYSYSFIIELYKYYMNNHVHRAPFSDIERKKEIAKSKERRKEIHNFINY